MHDKGLAPDGTAARVALWRALHAQIDPPPHVLVDEVGLRLVAPDEGWRHRPAGPQAWKRQRLIELGLGVPDWQRFVPVNFEAGDAWWEGLTSSGFDAGQPAVVVSTGVSMYLSKDAIESTLRQVAALAPGSTFAMTFMLPFELADPEVRPGLELAEKGARASGTPFISFFTPAQMLALARKAGFREVRHVSAAALTERYFAGRTDGLRPPNNTEEVLVAKT
jgi:O-methyltransferase involved in polyketide biosynthesis